MKSCFRHLLHNKQVPATTDGSQTQIIGPEQDQQKTEIDRPTSASEITTELSTNQNIDNRPQAFVNDNDKSEDKSEDLIRVKKQKKKKKRKKKKETEVKEFKCSEEESQHSESKRLENELAKLKGDYEELKKEKDELLTRLSAAASAKLTDGNPNIADLSDVNRPTKLAEQYSELYDNEWTDAFDVLSSGGMTEERACRFLIETFCNIYSACIKKANDELYKAIDGIKVFLGNQDPPVEVMKQLKDHRKKNSFGQANDEKLEQEFKRRLKEILRSKSLRKDERMKSFLDKSLKLCWLMVVQDPPVFVDTNIERRDEMFDSNELRAYTKSGFQIDYIVWPPLYLFKGGNLLCKGVAQCKTETSDIPGQVSPREENEEKIKKNNIVNTNSLNSTKDIVSPMTSHEEESIETEGAVLATSYVDNAKNKCPSTTDIKKKSIGKKIMNQSGKEQETLIDETKLIKESSTDVHEGGKYTHL